MYKYFTHTVQQGPYYGWVMNIIDDFISTHPVRTLKKEPQTIERSLMPKAPDDSSILRQILLSSPKQRGRKISQEEHELDKFLDESKSKQSLIMHTGAESVFTGAEGLMYSVKKHPEKPGKYVVSLLSKKVNSSQSICASEHLSDKCKGRHQKKNTKAKSYKCRANAKSSVEKCVIEDSNSSNETVIDNVHTPQVTTSTLTVCTVESDSQAQDSTPCTNYFENNLSQISSEHIADTKSSEPNTDMCDEMGNTCTISVESEQSCDSNVEVDANTNVSVNISDRNPDALNCVGSAQSFQQTEKNCDDVIISDCLELLQNPTQLEQMSCDMANTTLPVPESGSVVAQQNPDEIKAIDVILSKIEEETKNFCELDISAPKKVDSKMSNESTEVSPQCTADVHVVEVEERTADSDTSTQLSSYPIANQSVNNPSVLGNSDSFPEKNYALIHGDPDAFDSSLSSCSSQLVYPLEISDSSSENSSNDALDKANSRLYDLLTAPSDDEIPSESAGNEVSGSACNNFEDVLLSNDIGDIQTFNLLQETSFPEDFMDELSRVYDDNKSLLDDYIDSAMRTENLETVITEDILNSTSNDDCALLFSAGDEQKDSDDNESSASSGSCVLDAPMNSEDSKALHSAEVQNMVIGEEELRALNLDKVQVAPALDVTRETDKSPVAEESIAVQEMQSSKK